MIHPIPWQALAPSAQLQRKCKEIPGRSSSGVLDLKDMGALFQSKRKRMRMWPSNICIKIEWMRWTPTANIIEAKTICVPNHSVNDTELTNKEWNKLRRQHGKVGQ
jgi:hypothetical protein